MSRSCTAGAKVTGSGNNIAASDPSAGAAVTPRFIGRVEIRYTDGTNSVIVTDRSWRTALGPLVTDACWTRGDSKNHMILARIDEWFLAGLGGIRPGANAYRTLVIQPKPIGDLRYVRTSYETPQGTARSSWKRTDGRFVLDVTVPANTTAEVWLLTGDGRTTAPSRATFVRVEKDYTVYTVPSGRFTFTSQ